MPAPLIPLGVGRSGTTLLRVMLDRNSRLAIPDESFFMLPLARRHRRRVNADAFYDDLRRLPRLREWDIAPDDVRPRLRDGMTTGEAISAIFETYAEKHSKPRWGDKTPLYMQHLPLLERLFPDAALGSPRAGRARRGALVPRASAGVFRQDARAQPKTVAQFAARWKVEIDAARALGRRTGGRYLELRYEDLVADPARELGRICEFASLPWKQAMLEYAGKVDVSNLPQHQRLAEPPTANVRDWRNEMTAADARAFEEVAGDVLASSGYELLDTGARYPTSGGRRELARFRTLYRGWNATTNLVQSSPLWTRSHPAA